MRSKAGNKMTEELLQFLFQQRLPTHVQQILAISNDQLEKLADMAYDIMAAASSIHAIDSENQELKTMLMDISSRLSRLETRELSTSRRPERRFRHRSASRNSEGISPIPDKVTAITNFPKPEIVKELCRFLATCNFYRRFIPYATRTQTVLNSYLKGAKRNDLTSILWSEDSTAAFEKYKEDLEVATVL
ncbi:retrovirus-related Pol polyprotein from transposon 297 [Nephila pilipes]|uniref:Retrovirus-related Pol polyprotein from transposon 297 n=1 Tax=Nephila pilipes TaxID=299642 RepID=A0A8X6JY76_NEPPI|nr:retrovirus-related Pol polyprotein from transposon 297 [Nephila pilipes]